ncbi:uncharacterized protein LOC115318896 isoform X2 [Ixodes scapularis]|uniref:uncharacterized protein LOC115318896 isoform X2 n=1 Tax=Ixodes scapularis TaxID=6945 RepID=UPI001C381626|nr:uncharacterized protein LOC115318896 isoform X2 [Ixodes scapularis]
MFGMYNWTCDLHAVSCMEDFIMAHVTGCNEIMANLVIPYAKTGATWMQLKTACRGVQDFQTCVLQEGFQSCKDSMNDTKLLNTVTNGSFSNYSWTCSMQAKVCKEEYLENCSTLITTVVSPNIKEPLELYKLRQACKGVHSYQQCVEDMKNVCPIKGIYSFGNLSEMTHEIFDTYNWTCSYEGCTNHTLTFALKKCEHILTSWVKPYALNGSDDAKLDKACKGLYKYEDCVVEVQRSFCPNQTLTDVKALQNALQKVESYNWTCIIGSDNCTNANLETNIHECTKTLETEVIPHLDRVSNIQVAEILCKHVREYQICILQGSKALCPLKTAAAVPNLNELTSGMYTKYEWLCTFTRATRSFRTASWNQDLKCAHTLTSEIKKPQQNLLMACLTSTAGHA